jgi:hypothetical protein
MSGIMRSSGLGVDSKERKQDLTVPKAKWSYYSTLPIDHENGLDTVLTLLCIIGG